MTILHVLFSSLSETLCMAPQSLCASKTQSIIRLCPLYTPQARGTAYKLATDCTAVTMSPCDSMNKLTVNVCLVVLRTIETY